MVKVEMEFPKEMHELMGVLVKIVKVGKDALKDGFQMVDVISMISAAIVDLPSAIDGVDKLSAEFKENPSAFLMCGAKCGFDIAGLFIEKPKV